jgi:hypothetical protein
MKAFQNFLIIALFGLSLHAKGQQFRLSEGLYRIPYANDTQVFVNSDVSKHTPAGCIDMNGVSGPGVYYIVAAADGWIRAIEDEFNIGCHPNLPPPLNYCCNDSNNYVILEHPNGEWSTYIHLAQHSITNLGHRIGDWVTSGTVLGMEGSVGCSSGPHLHLEVSRPTDPNDNTPWRPDGVLRADGELLNPVFCGTSFGTMTSGNTYTAGSCADNCSTNLTVTTVLPNDVRRADNLLSSTASFGSSNTGIYRSGRAIELKPGFRAPQGSRVKMQIRTCNQQQ